MQTTNLPQLSSITELSGKRVLVRASLNVPVEDGVVVDSFRIMRGVATIKYLSSKGARVILVGHIGRDPEETMLPVYRELLKHTPMTFAYDLLGDEAMECLSGMQDGDVVLLENLRRDPGEKENDEEFAKRLSDLADLYVNDAFSVSHREHASIVGVPKFLPSYAGLNFMHEYMELSKSATPVAPSLFMLGGAKFDTKMPLVEQFLDIYDHIFIGGALANDFFKARGYEVGKSLVSDVDLSGSPLLTHPKLLLPVDVIVADEEGSRETTPDDVEPGETILDAGPKTVAMLEPLIAEAQTVLWNGPLGNYEADFFEGTHDVARLVAGSLAHSVIGGGDTVAAIGALNLQERFSFLSTAGGAMLTFLENGSLPGIEALEQSHE